MRHTRGVRVFLVVVNAPRALPRIKVEIAADAWPRIGRLPSDAFRRVRQRLDSFSDEAAAELSADVGHDQLSHEVTIKVDGFLVLCQFDAERQILTVRDIAQAG